MNITKTLTVGQTVTYRRRGRTWQGEIVNLLEGTHVTVKGTNGKHYVLRDEKVRVVTEEMTAKHEAAQHAKMVLNLQGAGVEEHEAQTIATHLLLMGWTHKETAQITTWEAAHDETVGA